METTEHKAVDNIHKQSFINRLSGRFTDLSYKYMPDSFIFALLATLIIVVAIYLTDAEVRSHPLILASAWGHGFWGLLTFTMQASLTIIGGYSLASTKPVRAVLRRLACIPKSAKAAVSMLAFLAVVTGLINWAFSLIFCAMLAKEIARVGPKTDYRALGAVSFLSLGTVWALGLSSSAALASATPGSLPESIVHIMGGLIPLSDTIFTWQSMVLVLIELIVVPVVAWFIAPSESNAVTAQDMGIHFSDGTDENISPKTVGERLEHSPVLTIMTVLISAFYLYSYFSKTGSGITLDTVNFCFLMVAFLLHWRPSKFIASIKEATPAISGVILQFPFYAGIFGLIVGTHLSNNIAEFLVSISNHYMLPVVTAVYSTILGIFVPSGGAKWIVEAPYILGAAKELGVNMGWIINVYGVSEAVANLIQPFWMLPMLGVLGLRARDVMGYTFTFFLILFPIIILGSLGFNLTF